MSGVHGQKTWNILNWEAFCVHDFLLSFKKENEKQCSNLSLICPQGIVPFQDWAAKPMGTIKLRRERRNQL